MASALGGLRHHASGRTADTSARAAGPPGRLSCGTGVRRRSPRAHRRRHRVAWRGPRAPLRTSQTPTLGWPDLAQACISPAGPARPMRRSSQRRRPRTAGLHRAPASASTLLFAGLMAADCPHILRPGEAAPEGPLRPPCRSFRWRGRGFQDPRPDPPASPFSGPSSSASETEAIHLSTQGLNRGGGMHIE